MSTRHAKDPRSAFLGTAGGYGLANVHSSAVSAQNIAPRLDRRVAAVLVGATATLLALSLALRVRRP